MCPISAWQQLLQVLQTDGKRPVCAKEQLADQKRPLHVFDELHLSCMGQQLLTGLHR